MTNKQPCFPEICNFECKTFQIGECYPSIAEEVISRSVDDITMSELDEYSEKYNVDTRYWFFLFPYDSPLKDMYVKIYGTKTSACRHMIELMGNSDFTQYRYDEVRKTVELYKLTEVMFAEMKKFLQES